MLGDFAGGKSFKSFRDREVLRSFESFFRSWVEEEFHGMFRKFFTNFKRV